MITFEHLFDVELTTYGPLCPSPEGDYSGHLRRPLHLRKPSLYLVSNLFPALAASRRRVAADLLLETVSHTKTMRFTGERFDQRDLDVVLLCVQLAVENGSRTADFTLNEMLRRLGCRVDAVKRDWLEKSLRRLEAGRIEIADERYSCRMRLLDRVLLDNAKGRCLIDLDAEAIGAFRSAPGLTAFIRERLSLRSNCLAKWLLGMLWVFPEDCLIDLPRLLSLSGFSTRSPAIFAAETRDALEMLRERGLIEGWTEMQAHRVAIRKATRKDDQRQCMLFL